MCAPGAILEIVEELVHGPLSTFHWLPAPRLLIVALPVGTAHVGLVRFCVGVFGFAVTVIFVTAEVTGELFV
jgi:hypothetical protein